MEEEKVAVREVLREEMREVAKMAGVLWAVARKEAVTLEADLRAVEIKVVVNSAPEKEVERMAVSWVAERVAAGMLGAVRAVGVGARVVEVEETVVA